MLLLVEVIARWKLQLPKMNLLYTLFLLELLTMISSAGFYFIPAALSIEEQGKWIKGSLTSFPQPPNRTNHNAVYRPIHNLFRATNDKQILVEEANDIEGNVCSHRWASSYELDSSLSKNSCKSILASVLLRKLRWSTLGLQFDWSKRGYNVSLPHNKIPDALSQLAKEMAAPAMPVGEDFQPEAAIVNYFGSGDMLGGHLDDMEVDWSKPIVSMSLGCKAIFLLGRKSRNDEPLAMFLRSGDIVLMSDEARECFHGQYINYLCYLVIRSAVNIEFLVLTSRSIFSRFPKHTSPLLNQCIFVSI